MRHPSDAVGFGPESGRLRLDPRLAERPSGGLAVGERRGSCLLGVPVVDGIGTGSDASEPWAPSYRTRCVSS